MKKRNPVASESDPFADAAPIDIWPVAEVDAYRSAETGISRTFHVKSGEDFIEREEKLTNFAARIKTSIIEDDGVETRRSLEIEAMHRGRLHRFKLAVAEFSAMNWPIEQLGPDAIVFAGQSKRDRAREGIQLLSGVPEEQRSYTHTGWREVDGKQIYLHAGGAIGAATVTTMPMALPEALRRFVLPEPPTGDRLRDAVRASMRMVEVAPAHIMVPIYGLIARAIIGEADFSGWITGETSAGKSEVAALVQQHFGAAMSSRNLPAAWQSTANANQELAFAAKDALLVVDDFVAIGSGPDAVRLHRDADHLLRGQGNRAGRQRMRADATLRAPRPPRGLVLGTGEDVPKGQSLRGRLMIVELGKPDLDWKKLTECQRDAAAGLYAEAAAGFIRWLAPRLADARRSLAAGAKVLREHAVAGTDHKRTPEITAQIGAALQQFLAFAQEIGAVQNGKSLWPVWWSALCKVNEKQAVQQAESNPAKRFVELLGSAISAGEAHVAGEDGNAPDNPKAWGWRQDGVNMHAKGLRVGWAVGADLFLDFDSAYRVVQQHGRATGEALLVQPGTLKRRLNDAKLLKTVDRTRETLHIRKVLEDRRRDVLHLASETIAEPPNGQVSANWSGSANGEDHHQDDDSAAESGDWSERSGWAGEKQEGPGSRGRP